MTDVLGEEMEETYNEAAAFWQELKRELARAQAEKAGFLSTPGILEEDLDLSSEDEEEDDPFGELDGMIDDSDTECAAARRRCVLVAINSTGCVGCGFVGMSWLTPNMHTYVFGAGIWAVIL